MKLYIATIIKHYEFGIEPTTFVSGTSTGAMVQVCDYLDDEGAPYDSTDILIECENGNQHNEPLSIGVDTDLCHEYLLTTKVIEI